MAHGHQSHTDTAARPTREVHDKLRQTFRSRREKGSIPYPVVYSPTQSAYDSWNQMFLGTLTQEPGQSSITLHPFEKPPRRVLDLGCGSGFWIIEAATKHWKETEFVGLDVLTIQPDIQRMSKTMYDAHNLVNRVKWVNANFLDGLPFEENSFDFVRICGLGLAVPEDEWQSLLHETRRVLEPGGVVEILEEDLIFPAADPPKHFWSDTIMSHIPFRHSVTAPTAGVDTGFSFNSALGDDPHMSPISSKSTHSFFSDTNTLARSTISSGKQSSNQSLTDSTHPTDPQDHRKLQAAWQRMLHRRFLAPRITAVLPFYINSEFDDMQTHPPFHITLPPNSDRGEKGYPWNNDERGRASGSDPDLYVSRSSGLNRSLRDPSVDMDDDSIHSKRSTIVNQRAAMHLARTVNLIEGCKDAIWHEYRIAYENANNVKHRSDEHFQDSATRCRADFDLAWTNWENDMKDRMSMRGTVNKWLSWSMDTVDIERPEWKVWRDRVDSKDSDALSVSSGLNANDTDLCRSLRGFVAWNTMADDEEPSATI